MSGGCSFDRPYSLYYHFGHHLSEAFSEEQGASYLLFFLFHELGGSVAGLWDFLLAGSGRRSVHPWHGTSWQVSPDLGAFVISVEEY